MTFSNRTSRTKLPSGKDQINMRRKHVVPALAPPARCMWRYRVTKWLNSQRKAPEWEMYDRNEREIKMWFRAIDVDNSGTIEKEEIISFVKAIGVNLKSRMLSDMLKSIGFQSDSKLNIRDFMTLMIAHGEALTGGRIVSGGSGMLDLSTRLTMLSYRRQTIVEDFFKPTYRHRFSSKDAFIRVYGSPVRVS